MIILPLKCSECGRREDIRSDQPMPKCPDCHGKMVPGGKVVEESPHVYWELGGPFDRSSDVGSS